MGSIVKEKFLSFLKEYQPFTRKDRLLLGLSGGVDSVVLYQLLCEEQFSFAAAHANFQLRKNESNQDEAFVKSLAETSGIVLFTKRFDTFVFARRHQLSVQMAARQLRYQWFFELMEWHKIQYLVLAHHADDLLETSLFHLIKGTSVKGLAGMPICENNIIRPLAFVSKQEILQRANEAKLTWREDESNRQSKYHRNYIRHTMIPLGKQINPKWEKTHLQTAKKLREVSQIFEIYKRQVQECCSTAEAGEVRLSIDCLLKCGVNAYLLFALLDPYGFTYDHAEQILRQCYQGQVGSVFYSATHFCLRDRTHFFIRKKTEATTKERLIAETTEMLVFNEGILKCKLQEDSQKLSRSEGVAYLDGSQLSFPLTLRYWQKGDKFIPLGMSGHKKVSDFLTDKKVPRHQKDRTVVVCSNKDIIWVVGQRIHNSYKVTEATKRIFVMEWVAKHN